MTRNLTITNEELLDIEEALHHARAVQTRRMEQYAAEGFTSLLPDCEARIAKIDRAIAHTTKAFGY